ncbi:MAG: response regulator transcription factor [Gaiellaceae bacterium]
MPCTAAARLRSSSVCVLVDTRRTIVGTVLLIEDEESIASLVRAYLEREGYRVLWKRTGLEGLATLESEPARLVILDIGLPDMDGFEVCRQIRRRRAVPIVMLTARDDEVDRITGLEVGADDYVGKPFSPRELVARVKAVLRRSEPDSEIDVLQLGDLVLRRSSREVQVGERDIDLRGKEFDLLAYLMENRGNVLSRDLLLDRVWGMEYAGGTRTVDVHVAQLRKKLGRPDLIRTVRGSGYKLVKQ